MKFFKRMAINMQINNITSEIYRVENINTDPFASAFRAQEMRRPVPGYESDRSFHLRKELHRLYDKKNALV